MTHALVTIAALVFLLAGSASAHHSEGSFERQRTVEIHGTVVEFKLQSPHSILILDGSIVSEGSPQTGAVRWEIESEPAGVMIRAGIRGDTFKVGDEVTVFARPHRRPEIARGRAVTIVAADGAMYPLAGVECAGAAGVE